MQCFIEKGWLSGALIHHSSSTEFHITRCPSPNFNARPVPNDVSLLVLHSISLPPKQFGGGHIQTFFCNQLQADLHPYFETIADLQVSAHLLIDRHGQITQFVSFDDRAWHAGRSSYAGRVECNDYSIGIELEGDDHTPYSSAQYDCLQQLIPLLRQAYPEITRDRITGHSDIAPERKTDPGPAFDWPRLKRLLNDVGETN